jgi:hypothetical protein
MNERLIFNPFLEIQRDEVEGETDFVLIAPKRNESLQKLRLKPSENERLYRIVEEIADVGVRYLDFENDLTAEEIGLFRQFAFLIPEAERFERTLFSCQLDDVETHEKPASNADLIVNPTFRFERFDLANFRPYIYEKHISPHQPIAWIKNPVTGFEYGFWLSPAESETIKNFRPGETPEQKPEAGLLAKLLTAGILVDERSFTGEIDEWNSIIDETRELFAVRKYAVIDKIIPPAQIRALQRYYREYIAQGFMEFGDPQVVRRFRQHNEPVARHFHRSLNGLMNLVAGIEVKPSYCYAASYLEHAELIPHKDRPQCEFSISLQVDYEPAPADGISPWKLYLTRPENLPPNKFTFDWEEFENTPELKGTPAAVNLPNGGGVFYRGCELLHYRYPLSADQRSTSLFFHFVPADFEGELA